MQGRPCSKKIAPLYLGTLILFAATFADTARADEELNYQKTLEKWSQTIPDLEKSDTGETAKQIALVRSWIGQAQAFVASEKFEKIDPILARVEAMVTFIRVRQDRVKIENTINAAETQLAELKQTIEKTKAEADAMLDQIKKYEEQK